MVESTNILHGHFNLANRGPRSAAVSERYFAGPARVRRLLDELHQDDAGFHSLYLKAGSPLSRVTHPRKLSADGMPQPDWVVDAISAVSDSETGVALYWNSEKVWGVLPPFPIEEDLLSRGLDGSGILDIFERNIVVGVILLRMGRYAIGVVRDNELLVSKTDTRLVKNRHRAGGSSQRRFMRSRDRLIRELYDEACEVTRRMFEPRLSSIDYVLTGGERQTINGFLKRCGFLEKSGLEVMKRLLSVDRPNHKALEGIHREVWKSRVIVFERDE